MEQKYFKKKSDCFRAPIPLHLYTSIPSKLIKHAKN
jgi:hypothetical protein